MRTFLAASIVAVVLSVPSVADARPATQAGMHRVRCGHTMTVNPSGSWSVTGPGGSSSGSASSFVFAARIARAVADQFGGCPYR